MAVVELDMTTVPPPPRFVAMQQHPHYATAIEALGGQVRQVACQMHGKTLGHAQIIQRRIGPVRLQWLPRGPVWKNGTGADDKQDMLLRIHHDQLQAPLRLVTPDTDADATRLRDLSYRELAQGQTFAHLDLTSPKPARLAMQHGKWRNRLRQAQASQLQCAERPFHPDADAAYLALEAQQRRSKRYRALPARFTQAWATTNRRATQLFECRHAGSLVAFVLILLHAPSASYHIGWTNDAGRQHSAHNLLLWRASNWLAERGYTTLDLGLIDDTALPGLTRFKLGMGAKPHSTGPTMIALPHLRFPQPWRRAA